MIDSKEKEQMMDDLIIGYLNGELNSDQIIDLIKWIKLNDINKKYFDEFCEIWLISKAIGSNPQYNVQKGFWRFRQNIKSDNLSNNNILGNNLIKKVLRYAAIFILGFSLGGLLLFHLNNRKIHLARNINEIIVPLGSRTQFFLIDGTEIVLNAGSRLKYNNFYGINNRDVSLEGEGYFKVARDIRNPFVVKTSGLIVTALGTEFNVKAYSDDQTIETILINGSVKIEQMQGSKSDVATILGPNQKLTFYKENSIIKNETYSVKEKTEAAVTHPDIQKSISPPRLVKETINVAPAVSWKENRWIFEGESLEKIAIELERKFNIQINFESERLKAFRFTGTIIAEPIEQVLEVMSISAPINFRLKGRIVTLSENKQFYNYNGLYNQHY